MLEGRATPSGTMFWTTSVAPRRSTSLLSRSNSSVVVSVPKRADDVREKSGPASKALRMRPLRARRSPSARPHDVPHHTVAISGTSRSSPNSARDTFGRYASSAGDSTTPPPNAFATTTFPARIASTRPGTPNSESARRLTGSAKSESSRRKITETRVKPPSVRRQTFPSRTDRASPSTSRDRGSAR